MSLLVIDSSIALAWCFSDESSPIADAALQSLRQQEALVPAIWPLEVANVIAISERKGRLTPQETVEFLVLLDSLPIRVENFDEKVVFDRVLALARANAITAYDASYLEIAQRMNAPLATLDKLLMTAALKEDVHLFRPE